MSKIDNRDDLSQHKDILLSEEHEDIIGGTKSGSETITASILKSLNQLNTNMAAMGESLKLLHTKGETVTPQPQNLPGNENPHQQGMTQSQRNQMQIKVWPQINK